MQPGITPAVEAALEHARTLAFSQGAPEVEPFHLLAALLKESEGRVAQTLAAAGLDLARIGSPQTQVDFPESRAAPAAILPQSLAVRTALHQAGELAKEISEDHSATSDLLAYVLLKQNEGLRVDLEQRGLVFAQLEARMQAAQERPLAVDEPLQLGDIPERVQTDRILDANANRAREALRVLEDYCRFALDDAFLSRELKNLRHELTANLKQISGLDFLEARETLHDVGTAHSTPAEQQRYSLSEVAQANAKRLQEALRSLEEFGKLRDPSLGQILEKLRYRSYTLEKAIMTGNAARLRLSDCRLYILFTAGQCKAALDWTIAEAAAGGGQVFQLREKKLPDRKLIARARNVRQWTRQAGVLFIMNDRPDIARLVEADGVHLGQEDMSVKDARRLMGPDALIGVSTHNLDQLRQAILDGASYVGIGPTFASRTKSFAELAGLDFIRQAAAETSLPAFALGGINLDNLALVLAAGARRAAVSQAIGQADDPRAVAAQMRALLDQWTSL
jgi:thiamine-phosphate pyrophosphorylase